MFIVLRGEKTCICFTLNLSLYLPISKSTYGHIALNQSMLACKKVENRITMKTVSG